MMAGRFNNPRGRFRASEAGTFDAINDIVGAMQAMYRHGANLQVGYLCMRHERNLAESAEPVLGLMWGSLGVAR